MCIGPLKRLCHWGPLTALGIIKIVSWMMVHCSNMLIPPTGSFLGFLNMLTFLMCSGLTIYNFLSSMFEGPGYLPLKWLPEYAADEQYLQYCKICEGFKAPRSHHCRKCGRCVLKMDHHCPWINNCVGHANHAHFTAFLFFSVCGCTQASIVMSMTLYKALDKIWYVGYYENPIQFTVTTLALTVFAIGLAIGVSLSVGALFFFQIRAILRNRTGIEDWILAKAILRREPSDPPFVYPYNLGWKENLKQVFNMNFDTVGDGITWPVVKGCNQYTLTMEQKEQKQEKRMRTRPYLVCKKYSGWWFPLVHGWRVCMTPPLSDEPRIPLSPSEVVNVTRWRKYWLFGEKVTDDTGAKRIRGWFPRCCVIEIDGYDENDEMISNCKKNQ